MAQVFLLVLFLVFTIFQALSSARSPRLPPLPGEGSKEAFCFDNDKVYKPWEKFANRACTGWCTCIGESGSFGCVSLCPPSPLPVCVPAEVLETKDVRSADPTGRCTCKRHFCTSRAGLFRHQQPPLPVIPECKNRVANEWFINDSCSGRCECTDGGHGIACVSLCPPIAVRCSSDMEKEYYEEPMDEEGRCTCKRERCVKKIGVW